MMSYNKKIYIETPEWKTVKKEKDNKNEEQY